MRTDKSNISPSLVSLLTPPKSTLRFFTPARLPLKNASVAGTHSAQKSPESQTLSLSPSRLLFMSIFTSAALRF